MPQAFIAHQQFDDASDHAQLRTCPAARAHSPQPTIAPGVRDKRASKFRQHRDGNRHEREHPCPCLETTDACVVKTEEAFRITKAFLTGEASRVLLRHPVSRQVTVRHQVPDAPSPVLVTHARLHQKDVARVAFAIPDASPRAPSLILPPLERVESAPSAFDSHMLVRLRADNVGNTKIIEQIEQIDVSEPAIRRQHKPSSRHATQNLGKERTHELAFITTHPLLQLRVTLGTPVERDGTPPDIEGGDQQMLRVFNRPIKREAQTTFRRQTPNERPSMREGQLLSVETRVVQQAEQSFAGGFKVVKESGESGLAASADAQECEHEITDGLLLMPVRVGQNEADILAEASG